MRRWLILTLVVASGCPSGPSAGGKPPRPPPLVEVATVVAADVPVVVRAPVDLRPVAQVDVSAKAVGYLDTVLVDRGDVVRRGQLLALVRPSDLPDQLASARGAVAQAEAANALAGITLERTSALAPKGLVSQQELQAATTAKAASDAQLAAAKANLAALATRLGETRLEAPFDGVVVARRVDPGALVGPATGPVLTVARVDVLRAFVPVAEKYAAKLRVGQTAHVTFEGAGFAPATATVRRLAPAFDALSRTLDAELQLPNPQGALRSGLYGRAEIEVDLQQAVPLVPASAVQLFEDRAFVYVLEGEVARRRPVTLGEDLGDRIAVTAGLAAGERLIVRGIDTLSDGAKVRVAGGPPRVTPK